MATTEGAISNVRPWWHDPSGLLAEFGLSGILHCDWYRFADGWLGVESEEPSLPEKFKEIYGECLADFPAEPSATEQLFCKVRVRVRKGISAHLITFDTPEQPEILDLLLGLFRDRGYVEMEGTSGWRYLGLGDRSFPIMAVSGGNVLVGAMEPWQGLIASCAINWVMRMQRELLFFHAASVGIAGHGVLLVGGKGAGKSTLSMALAALGHDLLGDELAAVRTRTFEVVPVRRSVSIRPGPRARQVEEILRRKSYPSEQFPDGTARVRAHVGDLFPQSVARSLPLRWVLFLRPFEASPRTEALSPRMADLRLLAPLPCTFWRRSAALPMIELTKLVASVKCRFLHAGLPEETARLVEEIVRGG